MLIAKFLLFYAIYGALFSSLLPKVWQLLAKGSAVSCQRFCNFLPKAWQKSCLLMLLAKQIVHSFHRIKGRQRHFHEHRIPVAHSSIP